MEVVGTDRQEEAFYSLSETARLLGVSERTMTRWIQAGKLPAYRPGKEYRIRNSDIEAFLEERREIPLAEREPHLFETVPALPTTRELDAMETIAGVCDRLERFLERAEREGMDPTYWRIETEHAVEMARGSVLPLLEREHLRPILTLTAARLAELLPKMFEGVRDANADEAAKRNRETIHELNKAIA